MKSTDELSECLRHTSADLRETARIFKRVLDELGIHGGFKEEDLIAAVRRRLNPTMNMMPWKASFINMRDQRDEAGAEVKRLRRERDEHQAMFWPHNRDTIESHLYEIRQGKNGDYVRAHALELAALLKPEV